MMDLIKFGLTLQHLFGQSEHITGILKNAQVAHLAQDLKEQVQGRHGKYPSDVNWKQLADSTQESRLKLGYSANDPLRRSGELAESYDFVIDFDEHAIVIGSPKDEALWNELGTKTAPARPVLIPTINANQEEIEAALGQAFVAAFYSMSDYGATYQNIRRP